MARFQPGQSGNPKGRPPRERALTALLESVGDTKITGSDGKRKERKAILAELGWQALLEGEVRLPNGRKLTISPRDWVDFYKWLYTQVDGPARAELSIDAVQTQVVIRDETEDGRASG